MSYVDGNSGNGRKALTGGTVALIQAGIALALVKGFTVAFIEAEPPRHLPSQVFPTKTIPPEPIETPKVLPDAAVAPKTFIDAPTPKIQQPNITPIDIAPDLPITPSGGVEVGEGFVIPDAPPADPPARFSPKGAKPRNDAARSVTTDDYPSPDIRAGHTGTVKFLVSIDTSGRITGCNVLESSGFAGLDAATCRNVTKRARFDPATDAAGERVAGSYQGTIRWVIPRDSVVVP